MTENGLSHLNQDGQAIMVDVGSKKVSHREAIASIRVFMNSETFNLLKEGNLKKGDALGVARLAGIQAAKQTWSLIPLCHQIPITHIGIELNLNEEDHSVDIETVCRAHAQTGVEMEALTAASVAALTIYDMCKAVDQGIQITDLHLVMKRGGRRGEYRRESNNG